jgi:hypothetical protein
MGSCRRLWPLVVGYGLLSQAMVCCRRLWPPVAGYGLLSQAMASCHGLWPLVAGYGLLSQAMASCSGLWAPVAGYGLLSQAMASCRGLWPPVAGYGLLSRAMASCHRLWPPRSRGFLITHNDAPVSMTSLDKWSARRRDLYLTTHTHTHTTNIHAPGGKRTHDRSRRAAVDLRLGPRGHWDWHKSHIHNVYKYTDISVNNTRVYNASVIFTLMAWRWPAELRRNTSSQINSKACTGL